MSINVRIVILVIIDILFVAGLGFLMLRGNGQLTPILGCLAIIAYVTWSILRFWKQRAA